MIQVIINENSVRLLAASLRELSEGAFTLALISVMCIQKNIMHSGARTYTSAQDLVDLHFYLAGLWEWSRHICNQVIHG